MVLFRRYEGRRNALSAVARSGLIAALVAAFGYGGQVVAAETNTNSSHANAHSHRAPESEARAPIIIQVEPSAKEVEAEAERQAAERKIFGLEPDAWVALFTLTLTCFTTLLWIETRRLAKGDRERYLAAHGPRIYLGIVSLHWPDDRKESGVMMSVINHGNSVANVHAINTAARIMIPGNMQFPKLSLLQNLPLRIEAGSAKRIVLSGDDILRTNIIEPIFEGTKSRHAFAFYITIFYSDEMGGGRMLSREFKLDYNDLQFRRINDPGFEQEN